ncbi:hypothetical protein [Leifsonia xyli]
MSGPSSEDEPEITVQIIPHAAPPNPVRAGSLSHAFTRAAGAARSR